MLLTESIDRLAAFEPVPFPVLSLYLDTRPDGRGRDNFEPFLRKAFRERLSTYRPSSPEHASFSADIERINRYLATSLEPSANGVGIFACAGADGFFEAVQLEAPVGEHRLFVDDRPHLYPLARVDDQYPRYAALVADTNFARIFVFGTGQTIRQQEVEGVKTKQVKVGGWSQARYQRHVENYHQQHVRDVVDALDRIVKAENISRIVIGGDEVVVPMLRDELPPHLSAMIVDVLRLDIDAPERQVLESTLTALRQRDARTDEEAVARLFDAVRGSGLGVVGAEDTLAALELGQVDELLITAAPDILTNVDHLVTESPAEPTAQTGNVADGLAAVEAAVADAETRADNGQQPVPQPVPATEKVAGRLVTLARRTAANIRFIEDPALLAEVGGVAALLRYRLQG
jgi:peptide chain release factor subunit 1